LKGGVKHLNPRQGITTTPRRSLPSPAVPSACETPQSPPGDYNLRDFTQEVRNIRLRRVKHLNPRQGITTKEDDVL